MERDEKISIVGLFSDQEARLAIFAALFLALCIAAVESTVSMQMTTFYLLSRQLNLSAADGYAHNKDYL